MFYKESLPIPFKDVKVNGQVKYFIQRQENNSSATNMKELRKLIFENRIDEAIATTNHIRFASCFKDGVYRYPLGMFNLLSIR